MNAPAVTYTFRPAVRESVGLVIGLAGASGSGKTYSALRLAKGIAGDKPFAVIDTEAGRAKHYADAFQFDHCDLKPPFRPSAYEGAILAADKAGYPAIVVDSFSHEHAGEGGILDWQEEELTARVKQAMERRRDAKEWELRDAFRMASWIKPKTEHKQMVQKLLQVRAHLILCFRAEEKIDIVKDKDGKTQIVPKQTLAGFKGWIPICEKNLPYELVASFILTPDKPGIPQPIKLQAQHRPLFPVDKPITEESGAQLAAWARGGAPAPRGPAVAGQPAQASSSQPENAGALLGRIKEGFKRLDLSEADQRAAWSRHCGSAPFLSEATDVAVLSDLLTDLRARAKPQQSLAAR